MNDPSYSLAELAFKNKELDRLFLGIDPYFYLPKFSGARGNIDLSAVIPDGIFPYIRQNGEDTAYLNKTLNDLCNSYEGIEAGTIYILCSTTYKFKYGHYPTLIDINELAEKVKKTINHYKEGLKVDFNDSGFGHIKGKYDYLRNLSLVIQEYGGPNFFPEENQQDEGIKL